MKEFESSKMKESRSTEETIIRVLRQMEAGPKVAELTQGAPTPMARSGSLSIGFSILHWQSIRG